jgi:hypothetical protein
MGPPHAIPIRLPLNGWMSDLWLSRGNRPPGEAAMTPLGHAALMRAFCAGAGKRESFWKFFSQLRAETRKSSRAARGAGSGAFFSFQCRQAGPR